MQCNLCGNETFERISVKDHSLLKCRKCSLICIDPSIPMPDYNEDYFKKYDGKEQDYLKLQEAKALSAIHFLKIIEKYKPEKGRLLEIGCATGFVLNEARKKKWEVYGVDKSKWARGCAKDILHIPVFEDIESVPEKTDVVVMLNTIEHLPDPKTMMGKINYILKPNGILFITTPNFRKTNPPHIGPAHRYYFTINTLKKLLTENGFEIEYLRCPYLTRKVDKGIKNVETKKKMLGNPFIKIAYKLIKKIDNSRLGSTIEILVRKK